MGIRNFRQAIFNEKKDLILQKVSRGRDFYSISSVKDLIFHAQEHRFTLPEIFKMLALPSMIGFLEAPLNEGR